MQHYAEARLASFTAEQQRSLGESLTLCQTFDHFLAKKFVTLKRYSGEGAESMVGFLRETFEGASRGQRSKEGVAWDVRLLASVD